MATTICARIYARGEMSFAKFLFFAKLVCQTVGGQFFLFCQNYMNAKLICQTVEVALMTMKLHRESETDLKYLTSQTPI
jgi:hypothetical protein